MVETKVYRVDGQALAADPNLWKFIKTGLLSVKAKVGNRSHWEPLHVRKSIEANGSELWVVFDAVEPVGFYVLSVNNDPFVGIPTSLFVWIAYASPGHWQLVENHLIDVEARAKELGIEAIEFLSPRKGWLRKLEPLGFQVAEIIHRKQIT